MKKLHLLKTMLLLCALVVGSSNLWAQSDKSATYTSNVTLPTSGSSASACTIIINETNYTGTKLGANKSGGSASITAPIGTRYIHLHVAAWNGKSTSFTYKVGSANAQSISGITSNSGIASNSPFTWGTTTGNSNPNSTNHYKVIDLGSALESETTITFASTSERVVFWGVNTEALPSGVTLKNGDDVVSSLDMNVGDDDITLTATVAPATANQNVTWESNNTSVATVSNGVVHAVGAGEATIKATSTLNTVYGTCVVTVTAGTDPSAVVSESALAFGDVEVGKTKNMTFTITPANLTSDLTIASGNDKYTVSPTSIDQDVKTPQTITVTAAPTALNDDMDGTITISGGGLSSNKTVTLSASPYQVSTVTLSATNGMIQQGGVTKTSITSRVGNTVTVTAVPNSGYVFDSWTATGATPASSNTEETEFTLTETEVTLTAIFIVDPRKNTTLDDETIPAPAANVGYGTKQTFVKDGLTWETDGYQPQGLAVIQLRTSGSPYLKVPDFSGNIQTITMSVTDASNSATSKNATTTTATLSFAATKNGSAVKSAGGTATNTIVIDLSKEEENYSTGYITSSGGARIWDITVTYIPTDINVSISSAKYATFSDHLARNFSGKGITVYTAKSDGTKVNLTEVEDGIVPANKGVVLYSASELNNVAIPVATTDPSNYDDANNELVGINVRTLVAKTASTKTNYILSNEASGVGFYLAADDGAYLPAHRAYLSTTSPATSRSFLGFDDETTGIESIDVSTENTNVAREYYNLNGQRVTTPTKGLYIVNGKKVIINK